MERYTEILEDRAYDLTPDDELYEEKLLEIASMFRTFSAALTEFIKGHGYNGDPDDAAAKVAFLRSRYKAAEINAPRDLKDWFSSDKTLKKRDLAFQVCFALGLNVDETNDFFRRVMFERSFDCHSINEAVYYFCIRHGLSYMDAKAIIALMPNVDNQGRVNTQDDDVLYTGTIIEFINGINSKDELVAYINDHISQFGYNNATATKHIQDLWDIISRKEGLAYREGLLLAEANAYRIGEDENDYDNDDDAVTTVTAEPDSVWKIYCQILGLDKYQTTRYGGNRSIKPLLEKNNLLPPLAEAKFPDRDGIEKIVNGVHVSPERIRKLMILLEFYVYWADLIVKAKNAFNESGMIDAERFLAKADRYLVEAGYPPLYQGNPYDWIFMWAIKDSTPLYTFREYINELFAYKGAPLLRFEDEEA